LSAVQPILPSIYAPVERTENDAGPMIRAEVAESAARRSPFSPQQTGEPESSDASPPMAGRPVETYASPAVPAPPRRETDAPTTTALSQAAQPASRPAPPGREVRMTPPTAEKNFRPSMPPPPKKTKPGAVEKAGDKGTLIKTFVPQSFGSKLVKSSAPREDAASISGHGGSAIKPDVSPHQDVGEQAPGTTADLPSAQKMPPASKNSPPSLPGAAKTSRNKFMPSLAATMKWIETKKPFAAEREASGNTTETGRSDRPESPKESSTEKIPVPRVSEAASERENKKDRIATPTERETFPTRRSESPAHKASQGNDRIPPVEVSVSIGHIEVKSAPPTPPAPRRTPPRPRVTLNEFLKSPYAGGPR
jgi:hypothetical protein